MMRRPLSSTRLSVGSLVLLAGLLSAQAQDITRDPTVPPGETGAVMGSPTGVEGMTVLVRDDKPYLMVGARLYAPGDKVGNLRVERITEKEVWFNDGSALVKVPRFAGIERKALAVASRCPALTPTPAASAAQPTRSSAKSTTKRHSPAATVAAPTAPVAAAPACEDDVQP